MSKTRNREKSRLYESEQRILTNGIDKLYDCSGDKVYLSLKSEDERQKMRQRSINIINSHSYMAINNKYIEESFEGIRDKFKINGRHKESSFLTTQWGELLAKERSVSNLSCASTPHAMMKVLLQLSVNPTQSGKRHNVRGLMRMRQREGSTSDEIGSDSGDGDFTDGSESIDEGDEAELEYAAVEEERRLWMCDFEGDSDSDDEYDENDYDEGSGGSLSARPIVETKTLVESTRIPSDTDPFFLVEGGGDLSYGGHISVHSHRTLACHWPSGSHTPALPATSHSPSFLKTEPVPIGTVNDEIDYGSAGSGGSGNDDGCHYSTSLLLPLALPITPSGIVNANVVLCEENEVCLLVCDMLHGHNSDLFCLSNPSATSPASGAFVHPLVTQNKFFSTTPTAYRSRLVHLSPSTFNSFLKWFVSLANHIQAVRNYAMVDFCTLRQQKATTAVQRAENEDNVLDMGTVTYHPTLFLESIQTSLQQLLRQLLESFEKEVCTIQKKLHECSGGVTLLNIHILLRKKWTKVMELASAFTNSVIGLDHTPQGSAQPDYDDYWKDVSQHEYIIALLQQLQYENDSLALLHCHDQMKLSSSTMATTKSALCCSDPDSSHIPGNPSTLQLRLPLRNTRTETNFSRDTLNCVQAGYLTALMNWLHSGGSGGRRRGVHESSTSELLGGFGGLHTKERESRLRPVDSHGRTLRLHDSLPHMHPSQPHSISDLYISDPRLRSVVTQAFACVMDMKILKKYQHKSDDRAGGVKLDTRDFILSVSKASHAMLSLHAPLTIGENGRAGSATCRGWCGNGEDCGGGEVVICSHTLNSCHKFKTGIVFSREHAGNSTDSGGDGADVDAIGSDAEIIGDDCNIIHSSFSSHKNVMHQNAVLERNSESLRLPYLRPYESKLRCTDHSSDVMTTSSHTDVPRDGNPVCFQLLVDIFPSSSLISDLVLMRPIADTISSAQKMSVWILQNQFQVFDHFLFLQNVFLLGKVSMVFESVREYLFNGSSFSSEGVFQHSHKYNPNLQHEHALLSLCDSTMARITTILPDNFSESLVTVTFQPNTSSDSGTDTKTADSTQQSLHSQSPSYGSTSRAGFSRAEKLFSSLDQLVVQIHYVSPISEILSSTAVSTYNRHMQFLLKVTVCCWTSEKVWKQSTGSSSMLTQVCSIKCRGMGDSDGDKDAPLSFLSLRKLFRSCLTGLRWIIYVSRALESFYFHEIHNIQCTKFNESVSFDHPPRPSPAFNEHRNSPENDDNEEQHTKSVNRSPLSMAAVAESHEFHLNRIGNCVLLLQNSVLHMMQSSITALGVFGDAHDAANANRDILSEWQRGAKERKTKAIELNSSSDVMVLKILHSRLKHTAAKMKTAQEDIVALVDEVESAHRYQRLQPEQLQQSNSWQQQWECDVRHINTLKSLLCHISNVGGID